MEFSIATNIKKGVVHLVTYAVGLGAAWLSAKGFTLTTEQQTWLIAGLTGLIGTILTMARNRLKFKYPDTFGWL